MPMFRSSDKEAKGFAGQYHVPGRLIVSSGENFPFGHTPTILLIDGEGKLVKQWVGAMAGDGSLTERGQEVSKMIEKASPKLAG